MTNLMSAPPRKRGRRDNARLGLGRRAIAHASTLLLDRGLAATPWQAVKVVQDAPRRPEDATDEALARDELASDCAAAVLLAREPSPPGYAPRPDRRAAEAFFLVKVPSMSPTARQKLERAAVAVAKGGRL